MHTSTLIGPFSKGIQQRGVVQVIYQTRETVFHRDIQTTRREFKKRPAAEYFSRNSRYLIYFLNQKKGSKRRSKIIKSMLIKSRYSNLLHGCDQPHSHGLSSYRTMERSGGGTLRDPGNKVINEFEKAINRRSEHFTWDRFWKIRHFVILTFSVFRFKPFNASKAAFWIVSLTGRWQICWKNNLHVKHLFFI